MLEINTDNIEHPIDCVCRICCRNRIQNELLDKWSKHIGKVITPDLEAEIADDAVTATLKEIFRIFNYEER